MVLSALSALESKNKRNASIGHLLGESMPVECHPNSTGFVKSSSSHTLSSLVGNQGSATGSGRSTTIAIAEGKSDFDDENGDERNLKGIQNFSSSSSSSSSSGNISMGSSGSNHRLPVVMDDYKDDLIDVYSNTDNDEINLSDRSSGSIIEGNPKHWRNGFDNLNGKIHSLSMTKAIGMGANAGSLGPGMNRPMSARLRRPSLGAIPLFDSFIFQMPPLSL